MERNWAHRWFAPATALSHNLAVLKSAAPIAVLAGIWMLALAQRPEPVRRPARTPVAPAATGTSSLASQCIACHRMDQTRSHPVDIAPSMPAPPHLPLQSGKITCVTCHDPAAHGRATGDPMLRAPTAAALCAQCHSAARPAATDMHAMGLARAHPSSPIPARRSASLARTIDPESQDCLSCHDGTMATAVSGHAAGGLAAQNHPTDHPIGISYPDDTAIATRLRGLSSFISRRDLDPRIQLPDGRLGCGSCHNLYSQEKHLLAIPNDGSKLCLSCHVL